MNDTQPPQIALQLQRLANESNNARHDAIGLKQALDGANALIARQNKEIAQIRANLEEAQQTIEDMALNQGSNT